MPQALADLSNHAINIASVMTIADLDGLPDQGPQWKEAGIDTVIAAGGDGLIGGVITHIADSGLALGILPLGTANDIARSVGIPHDLFQAIEVICQGKETEVDIGIAQPAEQTPHTASSEQGHPVAARLHSQQHGYFAHTLTVGLNVQFARLATNVTTRQRYGRLTYPIAALEVLRNREALEMMLHFERLATRALPQASSINNTNGGSEQVEQTAVLHCRTLQATIINAPIFGGAWQLTIPGASLHDRLLDIVVVEDVDLEGLGTAIARLLGRQENSTQAPTITEWHERYPQLKEAELTGIPGVHHVRARGVLISTNVDPQDVTLDGEVRGQTPIYVRQADERLRVIVPADHTIK